MKSLAFTSLILSSLSLTAVLPQIQDSAWTQPAADGTQELIIRYTDYDAGRYRLILDIAEDRSARLQRVTGTVVDLDGRPVPDVGDVPDGPGDPPPGDTPEAKRLAAVRANFTDHDEFERQLKNLIFLLVVTPGLSADQANDQIQKLMVLALGDTAEKWEPWLEWFKGPIVSGEVSDIEAYTDWIKTARESLQ